MQNRLKENLSKGIVYFVYLKANGEYRHAWGTTNHDAISYIFAEGNGKKKKGPIVDDGCQTYFDILAMGFRKCKKDRITYVSDTVYYNVYYGLCNVLANVVNSSAYSNNDLADFYNNASIRGTKKFYSDLVSMCDIVEKDTDQKFFKFDTDFISDQILIADMLHYQVYRNENALSEPKENVSRHGSLDSNARWCIKHNGGRGLNGVSLAAGGIISSGYDCFGTPISGGHKSVHEMSSSIPTASSVPTKTAPTATRSKAEILADITKYHALLAGLYEELAKAETR